MSLKLSQYEQFDSVHLPGETVGVDVTVEPLKNDEELFGRCVLLVKEYRLLDSVSITMELKSQSCKK